MESTSSTHTPEEKLALAMQLAVDSMRFDPLPRDRDQLFWVGGKPLTLEEFMGRYGKKPKPKKPKPKY